MALHAVDDLSDAYRATKSFLLPVEWGRWLRLALLSLFVAGSSGGGTPASNFEAPFGTGTGPSPGTGPDMGQFGTVLGERMLLILGAVAVLFVFALLLQWIASVFEFAFLEALRTDEVHVRRYTSQFSGLGTRLFAFRLVFGLVTLLAVGGLALLIVGPLVLGVGAAAPLLLGVLMIPIFIVLGIVAAVVYVFTSAFVAPIMLMEDRGVLSGWKRFWGVFKSAWQDFLVYVLVGLFLMIAIGIIVGIVMAIIGVALALPVVVAFLVGGPLLGGLVAIPAVLVAIVVYGIVQAPVQTYLRHWSLLVLGDVEPDLDLIPDRRDSVRGETTS